MNQTLIAHPRTKKQLEQYLSAPANAIGLSGDNGAGKGYVAAYLCASLLGIRINQIHAHPYVLILDAQANKTGIDDVRELQKFLTLSVPGKGSIKRVIILEHFDIVGHEAQNSLLKTLEEPPSDTAIIVTYSTPTGILPTIHSRLQAIDILPIGQDQAENHFNYSGQAEFDKSFYISGGLIGLLTALMNEEADHLLVKAINQSRDIIKLSRYQRLGMVDKLIKNNEVPPSLLLDGLYRLVDASYRQALKTKPNSDLKTIAQRLKLIEGAINDLNQNIQAKLVISRLFIEL